MTSPARSPLQDPSAFEYKFGVFTVDIRSGELRKHGIRVKLQERPFQLLVALVENQGEIVTREELRQRLWPEGTFVDFNHNISSTINKLRSALNDSAANPLYVETVGRRGYRFLADAKSSLAHDGLEKKPEDSNIPHADATSLQTRRKASWKRMLIPVIAAILALVLAGSYRWANPEKLPAGPAGRAMLAVLPFENLTGDNSQEYFIDGLTEEMTTQLGRLDPQRLGVIARASVMHYKNNRGRFDQINRELGVQYVLQGSIRRDSGKIRISAQLIQLRDQTYLWAREYDRQVSDLLQLQSEIAQEISDEIQSSLGNHKPSRPENQPSLSPQAYEAYNLYLQGLFFWNKRTVEGLRQAIQYFRQATVIDPKCARAYAGLADSYALMGGYSGILETDLQQKARAAALKALEIDESLPEAHTALALIVQNYDLDWQTAEKEFRRAIELNPSYATAHHWYAEHLTWRGRFQEAAQEIERARQLDPLSLIIAADYGAILYYSRQYDRAIKQFRYVLDMEPRFPRAELIVDAYTQKRMYAEAEAELQKQRTGPWYWSKLACIYGRSGRDTQAQAAMKKLLELSRQQNFDPAALACAYISLGNREKALFWMRKASSQHSSAMTTLRVDPVFDALREDPRFQELLNSAGLAQ